MQRQGISKATARKGGYMLNMTEDKLKSVKVMRVRSNITLWAPFMLTDRRSQVLDVDIAGEMQSRISNGNDRHCAPEASVRLV